MSFAELVASMLPHHSEAAGIGPHPMCAPDRTTSRVPESAARDLFFHDAPEALARVAAARLTPQPEGGRAIRAPLTPARFGRVTRLYVELLHDRSVVPAVQSRMCALVPGAMRVSLPTGHAPQICAPEALASILLPFPTAGTQFAEGPAADPPHPPARPTLPFHPESPAR